MDLYTVVPVSDRARGLAWFAALLGRPADEVVGGEALWQVGESAWVVVDDSDELADRAGKAVLTLGVTDLDAILARLAHEGIGHAPVESYGNGVRHVVVKDPDGNSIALAAAPADG